jgi:hypothetical protein
VNEVADDTPTFLEFSASGSTYAPDGEMLDQNSVKHIIVALMAFDL